MPELPEVETIKNTLKQYVLGKTIDQVTVYWPNIIKRPDDSEQFQTLLKGQTIHNIHRKGKYLLFELDRYMLISHLRMEGKYHVFDKNEPVKKHTHVIFSFTNGQELRYHDVRKFGTMHLMIKGKEEDEKPLQKLGPDPFDELFTVDYFYNKLKKTTRVIKAVLLDQTVVAGLGNIYVDETLYRARIHPLTTANTLSKEQVASIRHEAIVTLRNAVQLGGTTIRSYVNSQGDMGMFQQELFVYGQAEKPCMKCGTTIEKIKVSGRGTHVCPTCQGKNRA